MKKNLIEVRKEIQKSMITVEEQSELVEQLDRNSVRIEKNSTSLTDRLESTFIEHPTKQQQNTTYFQVSLECVSRQTTSCVIEQISTNSKELKL